MIDTHCHLLPFLDDGAADWNATFAMARAAVADGITECICTPHWTGAPGETDMLLARLEELRTRLSGEGIALQAHAGNEVVLVPRLVESLEEKTALTLAGSSYVLLETAQLEHGSYIHQALFQLQAHGFRIILAHPERVRSWQGNLGEMTELISRGCFLQVTAGSLLGAFGPGARKASEELLRRRWVSLIASDAHSPDRRPQLMAAARDRCAALIGEEAARVLVEENPARVLRNEQLPYVDPDTPAAERRRRLFRWPWSRD